MTTLEQIRAEIEQIKPYELPCDKRTPEHIRDMALEIIDKYAEQEPKTEIECFSKEFVRAMRKYAEQDKLMIIEANINGYTQGLKDSQRQSCDNCKQDRKECGNDDHYGFCQNWEYAEQEPTDEWQNGYDMAWEEAKVFYEKEEPKSVCDLCRFDYMDGVCGDCPAMTKAEWEKGGE